MQGSCLCKKITFKVGQTTSATACHCSQCRKQSGHYWASGNAPFDSFEISGDVKWYRASDVAQRGFCSTCGSFLFWKHDDEDKMSFSLGAIDDPTNVKIQRHIFVADKGDYYDLTDDLPQRTD